MPVVPVLDLPRARLLGLDVGTKTIGVAVSDGMMMVAAPIGTIQRTRRAADLAQLFRLYDERGAGGMVVGLPINMDGSEGPRSQSVRQFVRDLVAGRDVPVAFWDERLSTMAVERAMLEADLTRKKRAKAIDAAAAAYILQGALDAIGSRPR